MRSHRCRVLLAFLVLACGCARSSAQRGGGGSLDYVDQELGVSLRMPADWKRAKSWTGIGKDGVVASFRSPDGEATLTVGRGPFVGIDCGAAAREAVKRTTGAAMAMIAEFEIGLAPHAIPAGRGATAVGDRQGEARYFCHRETTVIVEASAERPVYGKNRVQILAALESVAYVSQAGTFALRAPEPRSQPSVLAYTVKHKGETLASVVEWYTGSIDNWRAVARATGGDLATPNVVLKVGDEIRIPMELVTRQDPMPPPRVKESRPAREPKTAKVTKAPQDTKAMRKGEPAEAKAPAEAGEEEEGGKSDEEAPLPSVIGPR